MQDDGECVSRAAQWATSLKQPTKQDLVAVGDATGDAGSGYDVTMNVLKRFYTESGINIVLSRVDFLNIREFVSSSPAGVYLVHVVLVCGARHCIAINTRWNQLYCGLFGEVALTDEKGIKRLGVRNWVHFYQLHSRV
jgi:hypothetical protein